MTCEGCGESMELSEAYFLNLGEPFHKECFAEMLRQADAGHDTAMWHYFNR